MSPSILQLQSVGIQDLQLTSNPQINIFKYSYYRYVNFATETVKFSLNEIANFGKKVVCNIPNKGHLLSKLHLHLKLPALQHTSGTYLSWSDVIGYSIFSEPIELEINGIIVDKMYPRFSEMWDELTVSDKRLGKNQMILKSDVYVAAYENAKNDVDLMIPLDFWFTKKYNMALPLLSMYKHSIKINMKFKNFNEVINYDGLAPQQEISILDSNIFAEYIYLDESIIEQFGTQKHTYLIEQVQYNEVDFINQNINIFNTKLKFNNPVKEIVFGCVEKQNIETNNHFAYSRSTNNGPIIKEISLLLDGHKRFDYLPEFYYRCIFPHSVHSVMPMRHIYTIPFCIKPDDNQPNGTLNMSKFNDVVLSLKLQNNIPDTYLYVYGISYNILTIDNGNITFEYSS